MIQNDVVNYSWMMQFDNASIKKLNSSFSLNWNVLKEQKHPLMIQTKENFLY